MTTKRQQSIGEWVARADRNSEAERLLDVIRDSKFQLRSILAERERQLRLVARMSGTGGWALLVDPLRFVPSLEWAALHGFGLESPPSFRSLLRLIEPPQRHRLFQAIRHCARSGEQVDETILSRHVSGRPLWMRMLAERVENEDGTIERIQGACQDITEHVLRQQELATGKDLLEDTVERMVEQRTSDLRTFSYALAHDLRAPVAAISGFANVLIEKHGGQLDAEGARRLSRIAANAQKAEALITAILTLVRSMNAPMRRATVSLDLLAQEAIERLKAQEPERTVNVTIHSGLLAMGDPDLLGSVVTNLVSNAWKFTGRRADARIEIGCSGPGRFFVKDNGAGFSARQADLFVPLKRFHSDAEYPGVGIGLATAYRIIQRHGGELRAESTVGEGTTMWFSLPLVPSAAAPESGPRL